MFEAIEHAWGKILNSGEMQEIISWLRDYHVTALIAFGFEHAASKKKKGLRYAESMIKSFSLTVSRPQRKSKRSLQKRIKDRRCTEESSKFSDSAEMLRKREKRIIDSWFEDLQCTLDIILDACSKTSGNS